MTVKQEELIQTLAHVEQELRDYLNSEVIYGRFPEVNDIIIPMPLEFIGRSTLDGIIKICDKYKLNMIVRYNNARLQLEVLIYEINYKK